MADNPQWYTGLLPVRAPGKDNPRVTHYKAAAYAYAIGIGQPMGINSDGLVIPDAKTTTQLTAGTYVGSCAGHYPNGVALGQWIPIWDDPDQHFITRCADAGINTVALAQGLVGTRGIIAPAAATTGVVDATTGFFKGYIMTCAATTAAAPLNVIGVSRELGQETGLYQNLIVKFSAIAHYQGGAATAGI